MSEMVHKGARRWAILAVRLGLGFALLLAVARLYRPDTGFTSLLFLSEHHHPSETATLRGLPHYDHPGQAAYDGQFYVEMAMDPLLRNPEVQRALDFPQYRSRRILFAWTAWLAGLGRPAWILQAYALQNVAFWLVLAWWLARRFPADDWRGLGVWVAVMFAHGLLGSVRMALVDGPSLLVTALAVSLSERGRPYLSAALVGVGALGRETNLLAAVALGGHLRPAGRRWWLVLLISAVLVAAPGLLWLDYLRSIYRGTLLAGGNREIWPLSVYADQWRRLLQLGTTWVTIGSAMALVAFTVQGAWLLLRPRPRNPWWRLGVAYVALMLVVGSNVWEGEPGAVTRVLLPLTLAYNLLLPPDRRFWPLLVAGNLTVLLAWRTLA